MSVTLHAGLQINIFDCWCHIFTSYITVAKHSETQRKQIPSADYEYYHYQQLLSCEPGRCLGWHSFVSLSLSLSLSFGETHSNIIQTPLCYNFGETPSKSVGLGFSLCLQKYRKS